MRTYEMLNSYQYKKNDNCVEILFKFKFLQYKIKNFKNY